MNGRGGRGRWTALPKRVLHRRRLEHKPQGSQTPMPTLRHEIQLSWNTGYTEKKGQKTPWGCATHLPRSSTGSQVPFPGPKCSIDKENETSQSTWDRSHTQLRVWITSAAARLGKEPTPRSLESLFSYVSILSDSLKPPFKMIPFKL